MKKCLSVIALALLVYSAFSSGTSRADSPYTVKTYPATCAAMNDQAAYDTSYLKSVWRIQQGEEGWLSTSRRDFPPEFGLKDRIGAKELDRLVSYLAKQGIKLMLVYPPTRGLLYPELTRASAAGYQVEDKRKAYITALQYFREKGIYVPDFASAFEHNGEPYLFFPKDAHWSQAGAIYFAKMIADEMAELGYRDKGPARFETTYSGIIANNENIQNGVEDLCDFSYPRLYVETHVTTELVSEEGLFTDEATDDPHVVLIGTSFSAQRRFNFSGYIQQFSNIPVIDYSTTGGGFTGSWINYLKSGDFEKRKPDLIIWEVPGWWQFEARYFDAILPYFQNGCDSTNTMMLASSVKLNPVSGKKNALFSTEFANVRSKNLLFDVRFSHSNIENVSVRAWFSSGLSKGFTLRREPGTTTSGRFLSNLGLDHKYVNEGIVALDVENISYRGKTSPPDKLTTDIRICRSQLPYVD
ncbi:hypothetical protein DRW07_06300 [Alteromonas sediminis]|uniref:AlgX/AlgJ SGNH hydrolase-like domain-containing protein n=1 Tax=Alteromonas sediminis TaxID=2259342 RepID=A0A3N5ZBS1_9ALTE|nr:alginate biosynthesis protein AlgX [Alteromonas sediminis]RPJ67148.1 hypothetical protein DRW07_06300 [Alteromonas sediminis]